MKNRSLFLILLLAVFAPWAANGQTVTIGTGTNTYTSSPIDNYYDCSFTEILYTAADIAAGSPTQNTIISMGFESDNGSNGKTYGITVYMKNVDATAFGSTFLAISDDDAVFTGTVTPTAGWVTFALDNAFTYDNTKNLLVAVNKTSGGYGGSNYKWKHTSTSGVNTVILAHRDGSAYTPTTTLPSMSSAGTYWKQTERPNVQLTFGTPATCPKPTLLEVAQEDIEANAATIRWTASNEDQLYFDIYWSTTNTAPDENTTPLAANQQGNSYQITGLNAATNYYVWIRGNCGTPQDPDISGGWTAAKSFVTACGAISPGYTCGFEGPFTGTGTYVLPVCWTRPTGTSTQYPYAYNYSTYAHGGSRSLYFSGSTSTTAQIGVLPEIGQTLDGLRLSFYARIGYSGTGIISIGYMTDPDDASTFVAVGDPITLTTNSYPLSPYIVDFGAYTGDPRYIAIKSNTTTSTSVYLDDLTLSLTPSCFDPTMNATATNIGTDAATVSWTAGGTNQLHWDVYYNKTGVAPTDATTPQVVYTDQNPFELTGLDGASTYYVWVRGNCGTQANPDYSAWSATYCQFNTECEAITSFPWSENYESYNASSSGVKFEDPCWENIHLAGSGEYFFEVYSGTQGTNSTKQLRLHDMSEGTMTKLRLPKMTLPSANYQFVIDVYRSSAYSEKTGEGIRVYASTNGEIEGATELAFIPRHYSVASGIIPAEATANLWYTYELPIPMSGTCYIILRGESQYGTATYMDNFSVEEIPTCLRPSGLACNSKTAHTATFSWTNGAEGQSAWQIAYSTAADFNPDEVTPVSVTSNPATIEGLAQSTTYYAYVRANCGNGDYSYWSRMYCTFSTITGTAVPTGLAVDEATITSSQATASWTGVATNDYHQSYEVYYSRLSTRPDPLENDSLITGITATSYLFTGLEAEKTYYVWVRDNCGTDGTSDWSSRASFTTASSCQTPDGLAESEVTNSSAKITWNTYGLTEFNLRYGTDGENWTTVTENVATPYTLSLAANTYYYVQVQAKCNTEAWSETLNFRTECDAITITDSWTEDFEDPVTTAVYNTSTVANLVMPYCWDNYTGNTQYAYAIPHLIKSSAGTNGYNYSSPASQVLYFYGSGNGYAALPEFTNALNELQISFKWATEGSSTGTLTLGYITAEDNGTYNTFTAIGEPFAACTASYKQMKSETVYLNNVPATATRLVFRWYYSSWYGANIDDIEVSLLPSCYPVGTLSYANEAAHTVELSWGLIDNSQDSWQVQYATDADFTESVGTANAATNANFQLGGLRAETHYYVRVRGNCGNNDYGEWSNSVNFTTDIACPAPPMQTATGVSNNQVTLSWTGSEASSFNVQYRKTGTEVWLTPEDSPVSASTITITGLEAETEYEAQVQAVCGGEDGESLWSASVTFTTLSNCAAPDELNATNLTANSATLNWTGAQESYNVRYRKLIAGEEVTTTEDFSSYEANNYNITSGGDRPSDWAYSTGASYFSPQVSSSTALSSSYAISGMSGQGNFLYMINANNYAVMPRIENLTSFSFKYAFESASNGTFRVGYVTDASDISGSFTQFNDVSTTGSKTLTTVTLTSADINTLNNTSGARLAFNFNYSGNYGFAIDDIVYTTQSITPDAWNTSNTNVTSGLPISGLEMNTMYEWQVQGINASCDGGLTDWSAMATFTTAYPSFTKEIDAYDEANEKGWYLIASPLAEEVNLDDVDGLTDNDFRLYRFNQNAELEWEYYNGSNNPFTSLVNGTGYLYANSENVTLTFVGAPIDGDSYDVTLQNNADAPSLGGWNLVGNPFGATAYITGEFSFYTLDNGSEVVPNNSFTSIEPMEAVFVYTEEDGVTLTFTTTEPNSAPGKGGNLALNVSHNRGNVIDRAIVNFGEGGTLPKFQLNPNHTKVYIPQDNKDYAIVTADNQGSMPVNFKAEHNGAYTLTFSSEEVSFNYLHLIDNLTGAEVDLLQTPSYTFNATTTDYESRFKLVFCTGVNDDSDSFAFCSNGNWIINNDGEAILQVIDVTGRILSSETINGSVSKAIHAAPGVYMLRLINGDNVKVQKIVVR